jgi:hypothetical protein
MSYRNPVKANHAPAALRGTPEWNLLRKDLSNRTRQSRVRLVLCGKKPNKMGRGRCFGPYECDVVE